jgi:hypothetical protein
MAEEFSPVIRQAARLALPGGEDHNIYCPVNTTYNEGRCDCGAVLAARSVPVGGEGWKPIETAPKDGTYILLRFAGPLHDRESPGISVGKAIDREPGWWLTAIWASSTAHEQPTHWQPLPAALAARSTPSESMDRDGIVQVNPDDFDPAKVRTVREEACPICEGKAMGAGEFCPAGCREGRVLWTSANVLRNIKPFLYANMPEMPADIHVLPVNDLRDHTESDECWCQPVRDDEQPRVVIHNSMDQREAYEQGRRVS